MDHGEMEARCERNEHVTLSVAGVDRWKGRWVVAVLVDGLFAHGFVAPDMRAVCQRVSDVLVVGVDIPIGLPEPGTYRPSDKLARSFVGPRSQSVFLTPALDVLLASSLLSANQWATARGFPGVSAQTFGLRRAILEVQPVAIEDDRLYEVHPEASFVRANGGQHLAWSKSSWNGINERRCILENHRIVIPKALGSMGSAGYADVLDAAIISWSAHRIALKVAESFPEKAQRIGAIWG